MRVLTEADQIALGNLCVQYATLIKAQRRQRVSASPAGRLATGRFPGSSSQPWSVVIRSRRPVRTSRSA